MGLGQGSGAWLWGMAMGHGYGAWVWAWGLGMGPGWPLGWIVEYKHTKPKPGSRFQAPGSRFPTCVHVYMHINV